jgi:hypothetical protein
MRYRGFFASRALSLTRGVRPFRSRCRSYFPFVSFDFTQSGWAPSDDNMPVQVSLNVFSISGQDPYYNLSAWPAVLPATGWAEGSLSFASLQPGLTATTQWTSSASYNWPYAVGYGGTSSCSIMPSTPSSIIACAPLVRACVHCGRTHTR